MVKSLTQRSNGSMYWLTVKIRRRFFSPWDFKNRTCLLSHRKNIGIYTTRIKFRLFRFPIDPKVRPLLKAGANEVNQYLEKTSGLVPPERTKHLRHGYAACVSYIDSQIGRLLDELDKLGFRENTIIVMWSDHGYKLGDFGSWAKHTNVELDTRVPLIISMPGDDRLRGKRCAALVLMQS